ncbi:MAG TPA: DUF4157 domain-containing protein [Pyrinomonadaceae bacterium]|nr:DUF4157 domain-containing protein [Pyrinomonadaceae bacterium]
MLTFAEKRSRTQSLEHVSRVRQHAPNHAPTQHTGSIMHLQRTIGNQAVGRLLRNAPEKTVASPAGASASVSEHELGGVSTAARADSGIQAKLTVSSPGDVYEQEADRVADQVMRAPEAGPEGRSHSRQQAEGVESNRRTDESVPRHIDEAVASPGQPLDASARVFFEQRFGHGFGDVRVHTDSVAQRSASAEGAQAYTTGRDLVFGAGQYQPHTLAGRWLLGHELAHVVQQRGATAGGGAGSESALEREAGDAAMSVTLGGRAEVSAAQGGPQVQFLRVSHGGFGKALEDFTNMWHVADKAVRLLQKSPTFMSLVATLDRHYIWPHDPMFGSLILTGWEIGPDGRMLKPAAAKGKRPLFIVEDAASFQTIDSPGNPLSGDVINIKSTDTPTFIQDIAHEATHAAAFVGGKSASPKTLVEEIEAGIQDEIATRKSEAKILGEIPDAAVKAKIAEVGSREPRTVERDVSPAFNLTYMELFFFARRLREEQAAEGLDDLEAAAVRAQVDKALPSPSIIPSKKPLPSGIYPLSEYAEVWYQRQTAVREWKDFLKDNSPGDPNYEADKEKLLQDHASRFFGRKAAYRPLPSPHVEPEYIHHR